VNDASSFAELQRRRFRALPRVVPAIATDWPVAWAPDRRYLIFLTAVGHQAVVTAAAERVLGAIAGTGVPPLEPRRRHLTIQSIGYLDELPPGAETIAADEASRALAGSRPVEVRIAGAGSFAEAAVLWIEPWAPLEALRDRLLDGVSLLERARAERAMPAADGGFAPHVSLAYYDGAVPAAPIAAALEGVGSLPVRPFELGAVQLVSVGPPSGAQLPAWDVVATFALNGA
jgi:2'-5' RNA ligase